MDPIRTGGFIVSLFISFTITGCGGSGGGGDDNDGNGDVVGSGSPEVVGSVDLPASGSGVAVSGGYAYVAAGNEGLQVVDVADKSAPAIVAEIDTIFAAGGMQFFTAVMRQFLYMAGGIEGVHVVEVTNPLLPALQATVGTAGNTSDVAYPAVPVGSQPLCAADGPTGVQVFPAAGGSVTVPTPEPTVGAAVSGDFCFVTGGTDLGGGAPALYVIDMTNPAAAVLAQTLPLGGSPSGIETAGGFAYVTAGDPGMYVIDIGTPASPAIAGQTGALSTTGPIAVDAVRMRAYLGTTDTVGFPDDGLKVVDISSPGSPTVVATTDLPDWTGGVTVLDGYVYATTFAPLGGATSQLHIVDVSTF